MIAALDARKCYRTLEPLHAFIYFAPQAAQRYAELGITRVRMQYFASRGAVFGRTGPGPVIATFYNFAPSAVAKSLPAAWGIAAPEQVLAARLDAAREVLTRLIADAPGAVEEATSLLAEAASGLDPIGRPLYAAHADLPTPDDPAGRLWHLITLIREWRGDGHVAVLTAEGVGGCEVLHLHAAAGGPPLEVLRVSRGWDEEQFGAAAQRLIDDGQLTADGALTEAGAAHRQLVEDRTDALAAAPWEALGSERCARLRELLRPFSQGIVAAGGLGSMGAASQGAAAQ